MSQVGKPLLQQLLAGAGAALAIVSHPARPRPSQASATSAAESPACYQRGPPRPRACSASPPVRSVLSPPCIRPQPDDPEEIVPPPAGLHGARVKGWALAVLKAARGSSGEAAGA